MSSTLWRATWAGEHTVVLKISHNRDRGQRELDFLRMQPPSADTPRLLGAVEEAARVLLLIEDLGDAVAGDILTGLSADQALASVALLGRVHAQHWGRPPTGWTDAAPRWKDCTDLDISQFIERYPHPWAQARLPRLAEAVAAQRPVLAAIPRTLQHADAHLDNWMFRPEPVLIDWETARYGPAIVDLVRFLMEGVHTHQRRACQPELLARWRESVPDVSAETLDAWLRAGVWYSLNAMLPHYASIDLDALSPRLRQVHNHCAMQGLELAADLVG